MVSSAIVPVSASTLTTSPSADGVHGLRAFHESASPVLIGVAVEDAREALGDHTGNTCSLDGDRCVLARGATAKVLVGNNDVTGLYARHKRSVQVFQTMLGKLRRDLTCSDSEPE